MRTAGPPGGHARSKVWGELAQSRPAQAEAAELLGALAEGAGESVRPPLLEAAPRVPDDLCLMEKRGGEWTLTALSLSAGTFFYAGQVVGRTLSELHGPVPRFEDGLLPRVTSGTSSGARVRGPLMHATA